MVSKEFINGLAVGLKEVSESGHCETAASSLYSLLQNESITLRDCVSVCEVILNNSFFDSVTEFWNEELEDYKTELEEENYFSNKDNRIIIAKETWV